MKKLGKITSQSGFTLIEIMVVVVIIGVLATMLIPNVTGQADKSRKTKAKADIGSISQQLAMYNLDNFVFPSTQQGLNALVNNPGGKNNWQQYLPRIPKDPWGNDYQYQYPGQKNPNSFDVWSFGADGALGGEGAARDIGNWDDGS